MSCARTPFIAGNWKMNLHRVEALALAKEIRGFVDSLSDANQLDVAVFPPSLYLPEIVSVLKGSCIGVGAQNLYQAEKGAFTGEISPTQIRDVGAEFVILGHSERRHVFGEPDSWIAEKLSIALKHGLWPIVCVGETLEEREAGRTTEVVERQIASALAGKTEKELETITIAYEPVWAIGTGKNATPEQAGEVHRQIRGWLSREFGGDAAETMRIQYGGSVKPDNAESLLAQPQIDGFLVGGASLAAEQFLKILQAGSNSAALARK